MTDQNITLDWSGFRPAALMTLSADHGGIAVTVTDVEAAGLDEAVYVWLDGAGKVIRVGTSKQPVGKRLLSYTRYINTALAGMKSATPEWEAAEWVRLLRNGDLRAVVHQPPFAETVAGPVRPYLDVERTMIRSLRPLLNRSHR